MPRAAILLPASTYRAEDFLRAARRLELDVVVVSDHRPTLEAAMGDRTLTVDFDRPADAAAAIVDSGRRTPLDAVVAVDDQGVVVAAMAAGALGLPHTPRGAAEATRDKSRLRHALRDAGVAQPEFTVVAAGDDVGAAASALGLPCVLKPRSLSGSRGVIRADTRDGAAAAAVRVRAISAEVTGDAHDDILLERFVPGAEVAVEALAHRGQITALAVFDKPDPLEGPYFAETIYVTPSRLPEATQAAVVSLVGRGCRAIGLTDGAVHAEVRLGDDGPRLIDVAARSIGGHCARVLRFSAGAALEELVLRHALGDSLDGRLEREGAAAGVLMLPVPRAGVLRAVHGIDDARAVPGVTDVEVTIAAGGAVRPLPEGDRYLGFVFARGDDPASVEAALRGAQRRLDVDIA